MADEYVDEFLQEAREIITTLNNELLALEDDPDDAEAMDEIFRAAHTLKGNFAALGFDAPSDLAHAMEDLLDAIREGNVEVTAERIDVLFEGVDTLEQAIDQIAADGTTDITPDELTAALRSEIDGDDSSSADGPARDSSGPDIAIPAESVEGDAVAVAEVAVDAESVKSVDALFVLEAIEVVGAIVETQPDRSAIEEGEFEDAFTVAVDASVEAVETALAERSEPTAVTVTDQPVTDSEDSEEADEQTEDKTRRQPSESGGSEIESVRVDVAELDELYRLVEQFVTGQVRLERGVEEGDMESLAENINDLGKTTEALQNAVINMRLVPFETITGRFPRLVRDLERELGKEVDFEITGTDVEIDRAILSELTDPLTHLLRNAVDHGIEPPEEREAAGKPPTGQVTLKAVRTRDQVQIIVEDDGAGLDVAEIREQAQERGLRSETELEQMSDEDIYGLVFHPGFSTTDEVSEVSGRGVGMDVVHQTITSLDGSITVQSTPGEGTTVTLEVPVTMAIVQVLLLEVGNEEYGVPVKQVEEVTAAAELSEMHEGPVLERDDEMYSVIDLRERFAVPDSGAGDRIVRLSSDTRKIALRCDQVTDQQKVVIKPFEGILSDVEGLSGTAVLGDRDMMLLIDTMTV